jgi:hypothetical protein
MVTYHFLVVKAIKERFTTVTEDVRSILEPSGLFADLLDEIGPVQYPVVMPAGSGNEPNADLKAAVY